MLALTKTDQLGVENMATDTIPFDPTIRKVESSLWEAACAFEDTGIDCDRLASTAYLLATSEVLAGQTAQDGFYSLAQLAERISAKLKEHENRFTELSGKGSAK